MNQNLEGNSAPQAEVQPEVEPLPDTTSLEQIKSATQKQLSDLWDILNSRASAQQIYK